MTGPAASARPVAIVRAGFTVVMCAALVGDLWLLGVTYETPSNRTLGGLAALAAFGIVAVWRQRWVLVAGLGASATSISLSDSHSGGNGRFSLFVDVVVLPAVLFVLLVRGDVSARLVAFCVALAGSAVALRQTNLPNQIISMLAMTIGLAAAVMGAAYLRSIERERTASVALARHAERLDLARDIHDVVGHHVTGMIVLAQGRRFSGGGDRAAGSEGIDATLLAIEAAGHETMRSIRRLVGALRDEGSEATATWVDIDRFVDELRSSFPSAQLETDDETRSPAGSVAVSVALRVAREAITNVRRHGAADGDVFCSIRRTGRAIDVVVENDIGSGVRGDGFGLIGMRERVEAVGGDLRAGVVRRDRWRLTARIPQDGRSARERTGD